MPVDREQGLWLMLRIQALRKFRTEYFHALRNGLDNEQASDQAIERVKQEVMKDLRVAFPNDDVQAYLDRTEHWGDILGSLIEFQILLMHVPVDQSKLDEIPPKDKVL